MAFEKDLRKYPRYNINADFKYAYNSVEARCQILNISEGGMLLKIPQILDIGDEILLIFERTIPYKVKKVKAEVKHININKAGVSYKEISLDDQDFIREYIDYLRRNKATNHIYYNYR
ncbi:MAG TPA: PilZ domain-containing protein [Spirochaetota bacterium]|nr:PilZ domain-containing protein [Spirochaetota bacterium]HOL56398.1 PilZ domain-containing protein [Spirochaetota bacterium]HPP05281.1 PilZ domain-containing protein [Spirochaetota bacterium]